MAAPVADRVTKHLFKAEMFVLSATTTLELLCSDKCTLYGQYIGCNSKFMQSQIVFVEEGQAALQERRFEGPVRREKQA
jgi:hypothetical protein